MKITQVKPIVIGYVQTEYDGKRFSCFIVRSAESTAVVAKLDVVSTGRKSKFRPVYAGNEEAVIDRFSEEWV